VKLDNWLAQLANFTHPAPSTALFTPRKKLQKTLHSRDFNPKTMDISNFYVQCQKYTAIHMLYKTFRT